MEGGFKNESTIDVVENAPLRLPGSTLVIPEKYPACEVLNEAWCLRKPA